MRDRRGAPGQSRPPVVYLDSAIMFRSALRPTTSTLRLPPVISSETVRRLPNPWGPDVTARDGQSSPSSNGNRSPYRPAAPLPRPREARPGNALLSRDLVGSSVADQAPGSRPMQSSLPPKSPEQVNDDSVPRGTQPTLKRPASPTQSGCASSQTLRRPQSESSEGQAKSPRRSLTAALDAEEMKEKEKEKKKEKQKESAATGSQHSPAAEPTSSPASQPRRRILLRKPVFSKPIEEPEIAEGAGTDTFDRRRLLEADSDASESSVSRSAYRSPFKSPFKSPFRSQRSVKRPFSALSDSDEDDQLSLRKISMSQPQNRRKPSKSRSSILQDRGDSPQASRRGTQQEPSKPSTQTKSASSNPIQAPRRSVSKGIPGDGKSSEKLASQPSFLRSAPPLRGGFGATKPHSRTSSAHGKRPAIVDEDEQPTERDAERPRLARRPSSTSVRMLSSPLRESQSPPPREKPSDVAETSKAALIDLLDRKQSSASEAAVEDTGDDAAPPSPISTDAPSRGRSATSAATSAATSIPQTSDATTASTAQEKRKASMSFSSALTSGELLQTKPKDRSPRLDGGRTPDPDLHGSNADGHTKSKERSVSLGGDQASDSSAQDAELHVPKRATAGESSEGDDKADGVNRDEDSLSEEMIGAVTEASKVDQQEGYSSLDELEDDSDEAGGDREMDVMRRKISTRALANNKMTKSSPKVAEAEKERLVAPAAAPAGIAAPEGIRPRVLDTQASDVEVKSESPSSPQGRPQRLSRRYKSSIGTEASPGPSSRMIRRKADEDELEAQEEELEEAESDRDAEDEEEEEVLSDVSHHPPPKLKHVYAAPKSRNPEELLPPKALPSSQARQDLEEAEEILRMEAETLGRGKRQRYRYGAAWSDDSSEEDVDARPYDSDENAELNRRLEEQYQRRMARVEAMKNVGKKQGRGSCQARSRSRKRNQSASRRASASRSRRASSSQAPSEAGNANATRRRSRRLDKSSAAPEAEPEPEPEPEAEAVVEVDNRTEEEKAFEATVREVNDRLLDEGLKDVDAMERDPTERIRDSQSPPPLFPITLTRDDDALHPHPDLVAATPLKPAEMEEVTNQLKRWITDLWGGDRWQTELWPVLSVPSFEVRRRSLPPLDAQVLWKLCHIAWLTRGDTNSNGSQPISAILAVSQALLLRSEEHKDVDTITLNDLCRAAGCLRGVHEPL